MKKSTLLWLIVICLLLGTSGISSIWKVNKFHSQIDVGMSLKDVVSVLSEINDREVRERKTFIIRIYDEDALKKCFSDKKDFEECKQNNTPLSCYEKYGLPQKAGCDSRFVTQDEFAKIVSDAGKKIIVPSYFEAKIRVCFIGPGFLKNDFAIYFSEDGMVNKITAVRRWD